MFSGRSLKKKKKEINASKIYSPFGNLAERAKLHNKAITDIRLHSTSQSTTLGSYAKKNLVEIDVVVFGYYTLSSRCLEIHTECHMVYYVNR